MHVSKAKVIFFRVLMWGGIGLAAIGTLFYYADETLIDGSLALLAGGLLISFVGGCCLRRLFRCPNCKTNVLGKESSIDLRSSACPKECPNCQTPIEFV